MTDFIYGVHAVSQLLQQPQQVSRLWVLSAVNNPRLQALVALAQQAGIAIKWVDRPALEQMVGLVAHQGVVASPVAASVTRYTEADLLPLLARVAKPLVLILDGVQDPHNLGACLRTADASGVTAVIIPKDRAVSLTAVVSKVACGAAETVPLIAVTNLVRTLNQLKQQRFWIVGTAGDAPQSLYELELDLSSPLALVMGAEDKGLRRLTREACDHLVAIPLHGRVSSLNISVAAGVCLFEMVRQQSKLCG